MLNQKAAILAVLFPVHSILAHSDKQAPPQALLGCQVEYGPIANADGLCPIMHLDSQP